MRRSFLLLLFLLTGPASAWGETIYAIESGWRLVWFDSETPGTLSGSLPITGELDPYYEGATIEFDPLTHELYAFAVPACQFTCPPLPIVPMRIDLTTGVSTYLPWAEFPYWQITLYDFDIHPETRELRMIQDSLGNLRFSLDHLELHVDQPLDKPGRYVELAHRPRGGAHGGETLAIYYPPENPEVPHLARIGGVGGNPPASSGEVTALGAIDIPHYILGFDISPSGGAYLLADTANYGAQRLYRLDIETLTTEDLGAIATPSPGPTFVSAIAAAPAGLGAVVEVPAVSSAGLVALSLLLAMAAIQRSRRQA